MALGSGCRVASLPPVYFSLAKECLQARMGQALSAGKDGPNPNILRIQGRHPVAPLSLSHTGTSNALFHARSTQDRLPSFPFISQALTNESILNNLSNDQLAQMNTQNDNRHLVRLVALLQSRFSSDTPTNQLLQSNLLAAFALIQEWRQPATFSPFSQLSDEDLVKYVLYTQNHG